MTVDEARLRSLDEKARQVLGEDDGATFMEVIGEHGWSDLATKTDVAGLKTDVAGLKTDVAGLKTDVAGLKTDVGTLKRDLAAFETRIDHRFEVLGHQWGERLERELRHMTMRMTTIMGTFVMGGMVIAAGIARISV